MSARDEFVKAALGKDGENLLRYMKLDKESMGNIEKSEEKYKDVPEPETMADVVGLFAVIKKFAPNAILHCASFGCKAPCGMTLVATAPIDFEVEAKRFGVDLESGLAAKMKKRGKMPDEIGIVDKDKMVLPMLTNMVLSICQDNNYDAVKVTKAMVEATKRLRNETGMI